MKNYKDYLKTTGEVGRVVGVNKAVVTVADLPNVRPDELVVFKSGELGVVVALDEELAQIAVLSETQVNAGVEVVRSGHGVEIEVGDNLLGRVIDPLGRSLFLRTGKRAAAEKRALDIRPANLKDRGEIKEPLLTGMTLVDMVLPLSKGQRELIIGGRQTGKTRFVLQTMLTQVKQGAVCVYAAVAKKAAAVKRVEAFLKVKKLADQVVMVAATAAEPPGLSFLAPFAAITVAEYFRDQGREVVVVLDDLTAHAKVYREMSLLAGRFPGRSSYPGDIFHTQARLLERGGKFKGGGVISVLPVAETVGGNLTGYIQTNLMAITDGHLYFDKQVFDKGQRPAINPFLSVTRVGRASRTPFYRRVAAEVLNQLNRARQMEDFLHFGAEAGEGVQETLELVERLALVLFDAKGEINEPEDIKLRVFFLALLWANVWQGQTEEQMKTEMDKIGKDYQTKKAVRDHIDGQFKGVNNLFELVNRVKEDYGGN